ncbi:MAG: ABC transporter ATP-binding protein/permease [Rickettsiales bacterium]|jgi:ABC-type multidrug transport system fused ATPase/permease subunit|nr:ABC transporter ATP-binding protein/permease [Rickettsiales bacterium]
MKTIKKLIPESYPLECSLIENPRTLIGYLRKNFWAFFGWGFVFYALFFIISRTGFSMFPAVQMQMLTDLLDGAHNNFWYSATIVLGIILIANLFFKLCDVAQNLIWQRVRPNSRSKVLMNLINYVHCQSMDFINKKMLGKMSQQANNIAFNSVLIIQKLFAEMMANFIAMIIALGLILRLHWSLTALVAGGMIIRFLWFKINFKKIIITNKKLAAAVSQIHGATTDTIGGAMNVRAFSGRMKELALLDKVMQKYDARYQAHTRADRKFWGPLSFLEEIVFAAAMLLCVFYFRSGAMTLGEVVFMIGAYASINSSVWNLIWKWTELFETGTEAYQNYKELVAKISVKDKSGAPDLIARRGAINFDDVDFRYDKKSHLILRDFYLSVKSGEHIGIVGASGGGKTTLLKLLMRMYDVNAGEITIDGQNIANVSLDSLRKSVAFIPQDTALFNRTILENLRYAAPNASLADVIRAAKFAGAHKFIMEQPGGYNTIVGDRGVKLSGGQRQRIAIARAFLQSAPILLIDEATSALDSETEEIIQNSIAKISRGKTMLVIAHRLSTLKNMNRIVVIDGGKIVESGTHEQLIRKRGGIYAKMWKNQSDGFVAQ